MSSKSMMLEDLRAGVPLKISALWIATLVLFAYGDVFGFFVPGRIEEVMAGRVSGIRITQVFLLGVSVYIAIASLMIFLTLVLRPSIARWANVILPALYVASIVASFLGETSAHFIFLSVAEGGLLVLLIWYAWTWPRPDDRAA